MKLVIQRVSSASVESGGNVVGKIGLGIFVLVGIQKDDGENKADELVKKLVKLRIMSDKEGKMNLSILDTKSEVLLVSQFTLLANTQGGNRPSFIDAEEPEKAKKLYLYMKEKLEEKGIKVETGSFGNYMEIETVLDGPVTIVLEN